MPRKGKVYPLSREEGKDEVFGKVERIYSGRKYMGGIRKFEECNEEGGRV